MSCYSIAGLTFALRCSDPAAVPVVTRGWRPFGVPAGLGTTTTVNVSISDHPPFDGPERFFPVLERRAAQGDFIVRGEDYVAEVSADLGRVHVRQPADAYPSAAVLKLVLGAYLLGRGGVLVHGVGLAKGGRAALFTGQSGAGKSTLGGLWRASGYPCLADELVAVFADDAGARAMGTPWNVGAPEEAALVAAGTLAWGPDSSFDVTEPGSVLRMLSTNTLFPDDTTQTRHQVFGVLARVLQHVRTGCFTFARDAGAAAALRDVLAG